MRKISELNLNTVNASASGLWQIKTAHKNLGCASVFMTVFICHKPEAEAFIVYLSQYLFQMLALIGTSPLELLNKWGNFQEFEDENCVKPP